MSSTAVVHPAPEGSGPVPVATATPRAVAPSWMPLASFALAVLGCVGAILATVLGWGARYGTHEAAFLQLQKAVEQHATADAGERAELRAIGERLVALDERMKAVDRRFDGVDQALREIRSDLRDNNQKR